MANSPLLLPASSITPFRHIPAMVQSMDRDGRLIDVSQPWLDLLGYRAEDVLGVDFFRILCAESCDMIRRAFTEDILYGPGYADRVPATLRRANGGTLDILVTLVAETERVTGYFVETTDSEDKIRQRDMWLRAILDNSPLQVVIKDKEHRFLAVSDNVASERGAMSDAVIGMRVSDFFPPEIAQTYIDADRVVLERGETLTREVREVEGDQIRYIRNSKFPLRDDNGEIMGIGSISMDVSELKHMEEKLAHAQKMEAVGQLTGGIAHDFNNLLMVVSGNLEIIGRKIGDSEELAAAKRAISRGADLTWRLLAFSRQQILQPRAVTLHETMAEIGEMIRRTMSQSINVEIDIAANLDPVLVDPNQLHNAVLNLAINARDAMTSGGTLSITAHDADLGVMLDGQPADAAPGRYIQLSVADTGTGIDPEVLGRVFDPFFTTKPDGMGTGLGLSMVYGFVKQSGGHVAIRSTPKLGTTVDLYLPLAPDHMVAAAPAAQNQEDAPMGRGESILFLDDDSDIRALAKAMLGELGYEVTLADGPTEAVVAHRAAGRFDVLISDILLGSALRGTDVAILLSHAQPELKLLFITGYAEAESADRSLPFGAPLLHKPFSRSALARTLRELIEPVGETAAPKS